MTTPRADVDRRELELLEQLVRGRCPAPFDVLGRHPLEAGGWRVRAFLPWASEVRVLDEGELVGELERRGDQGVFEGIFSDALGPAYRLRARDPSGRWVDFDDPYRFSPQLDEDRVRAFLNGCETRIHEVLGAHPTEVEGVSGTRFGVWAPHARAVSVIGTMNGWEGHLHPMRPRGDTGAWEIFLPHVGPGTLYKYRVVGADGRVVDKTDPFAFAMELRPATASSVAAPSRHEWTDGDWVRERREESVDRRAMAVYEVHLGSWRRTGSGGWPGYRELAETLLPYVADLGFTHVELLPVMEHPLDESWGYQTVGYFAPTSRYGGPDDLRWFVDRAHGLGLGVILDWTPAHFPADEHGLARFDGTALFEHPDPRRGTHPDWGTLVFDYGRPAVRSFLMSSALRWLEDFHADGLRVDAVASMLYLDYSREEGEWLPNEQGGRENLDAVGFFRELADAVDAACPGALLVAEESTAWPRVSHGTDRGGLGFHQKWNLGWMHDTLEYFSADPLFRSGLHQRLTFSVLYAFTERFVLPFSHDEVVHGKGSLLGRMPGGYEERFANLRLLLAWQWSHPGKKLLFMGGELGQWSEWDVGGQLDWHLLGYPSHQGVQRWVRALNQAYRETPALHVQDFRDDGFEWLDVNDRDRSILSFLRWAPGWSDPVAVALNFTPVDRQGFVLPVPFEGRWEVLLSSDAGRFGGRDRLASGVLDTRPEPLHGRKHVVEMDLPGLTAVFLRHRA